MSTISVLCSAGDGTQGSTLLIMCQILGQGTEQSRADDLPCPVEQGEGCVAAAAAEGKRSRVMSG